PRVLLTGGEHQDVTRRAAGLQQQVDRFLGRVQGSAGRGRDQLELGRGTILRPARSARRRYGSRCGRGYGCGVCALCRRRGARGAGDRTAGTRRGRGTRTWYGAGGRRGTAGGRSDAGTLGTLVNLRLLKDE